MEHANRRFTQKEESLLKRARGARLLSMDAVLAAPPDNSWNSVRLHFDGFDIDLSCRLHGITIDELGTVEEFGLLSVEESRPEPLDIPEVGAGTTVFPVDEVVMGVSVLNDIVRIYGDSTLVAQLEFPQAVAFTTESGIIMLDKEVWFSEMIAVKRGDAIGPLLYDDSVNWEDDPDEDPATHFEFHVECRVL